uniref:Uncharacterized protein n=1 Tax=Opuntia streptacantha TaxID=393608 RepID=A0A7C9DYM4_OPUST
MSFQTKTAFNTLGLPESYPTLFKSACCSLSLSFFPSVVFFFFFFFFFFFLPFLDGCRKKGLMIINSFFSNYCSYISHKLLITNKIVITADIIYFFLAIAGFW